MKDEDHGAPSSPILHPSSFRPDYTPRVTTLLCTVRECHRPLVIAGRRAECEHGHAFDVARSGYLNLLQPQDRRSRHPGDSVAAVAARRRFLDRGLAAPITEGIVRLLSLGATDTVLDAGCGVGHDLGAIRDRYGCEAHGVDISVPAIDAAARRYRDCLFVVANADRFLPYADASFDAVTSITARLNAPEYHRVLRPHGTLLVAVPAPDDLLELRAAVLGDGVERDRVQRTIDLFAPHFKTVSSARIKTRAQFDREAIADVMTSSYRALRTRERERLATVADLEVTLSRDVIVFRRVGG